MSSENSPSAASQPHDRLVSAPVAAAPAAVNVLPLAVVLRRIAKRMRQHTAAGRGSSGTPHGSRHRGKYTIVHISGERGDQEAASCVAGEGERCCCGVQTP